MARGYQAVHINKMDMPQKKGGYTRSYWKARGCKRRALHSARVSLGGSWLESGSSVTKKGNLPYRMRNTNKVGSVSVLLVFS